MKKRFISRRIISTRERGYFHCVSWAVSLFILYALQLTSANVFFPSGLIFGPSQLHAAQIKTVRRGSVTFTSQVNRMAVSLSPAVDPSKTIVWGGISHGGGRSGGANANDSRVGFDLESTSTLALERLGSPSSTPILEWQVVEFESGVSVQRGLRTLSTSEATVNVPLPTAVDLTKSFVLVSVAPNTTSQTTDERWTIRSRLTTSTNLELSRNESGIAVDVYWQVIQMEGASVRRGLTTLGAGESEKCTLIRVKSNVNSFLIMSFKGTGAVNGIESQYLTRGSVIHSGSNMGHCFNRVSTVNSVEVAWELVSMIDGTAVQAAANATTAVSDTIIDRTIAAVDLNRSFVYIGTQGGSGTDTTNLDEGSWTANLTSSTNLRLQRGGGGTLGTVNWQVIQFAAVLPVKLAITAVNSGQNPQAGVGFPVVVQAQDANGTARNVVSATNVSLTLKTGTGTLGGTLIGTIAAGASQVTINGVTYTRAESGISLTASRTSGDALTPGDSALFTVNPGAATNLVFTTQPANAVAGGALPGPPTITVQDNFGNTVTSSTASITIAIGANPGNGTLSGTTTRSAVGGLASFSDLTINKAGVGYTLSAASATLASATSSSFDIAPGGAVALAFITQPGNVNAGAPIAGPPTIVVQDSFGNIVSSSSAAVTVAIGANPGGGALSGTTNKNAISGVAAFTDLNISQAGNGYTLAATSAGLSGTTSNAFNITASSGLGIISGLVTRVSDGTPINGAQVEVFQGTVLMGSATTTGTGSYSIGGLADGVYTLRASSAGFVPQVHEGITIISAASVTVNLTLNVGIAIHSPVGGAVINDFSVLVTGQFDTSIATEVGINVNGYVALQSGDEFALLVPVDAQTTGLTAILTDLTGIVRATHTIPITPQPPTGKIALSFKASAVIALVSEPVGFTLSSRNSISQVELDGNGDGTIDFTGSTLRGVTVTFAQSGLYFPSVRVTESSGVVRTATAMVQIFDQIQLNTALQAKWAAMKNALRQGNISAALPYIVARRRTTYQNMFNSLTIPFADIDQILANINFVRVRGVDAEYEMSIVKGGSQYSYMVLFSLDEDGVWRIKFF